MYLHIITLIVYGLLGLQYDASSVDSEVVTMMTAAIQENFHMNILLLLPAVAVIVMAICKCPSIPTLMVSTLVAVVLAMLVQGQTLSGILNILDSGFSIDTALPEFNRLVNRGGLQSMLWTAALGILGMLYGSIMEKTGLLEALLSKMDPLVKSTGGLVTAVVLTCTLLLMATATQTLAIVVGGRMYIGEFKKKTSCLRPSPVPWRTPARSSALWFLGLCAAPIWRAPWGSPPCRTCPLPCSAGCALY